MSDTPWRSVLGACLPCVASPNVEVISYKEAFGRILLETVVADRDYPSGNLSTMDGYAVGDEQREDYRVSGENFPGGGPGSPLEAGTARRIFTGGEIPLHATRVIPQESTHTDGSSLWIDSLPNATYIRRAGSEAMQGAQVLSPGLRLDPISMALLASVGAVRVRVAARPRIAHIVTGSELIEPDVAQAGSFIRDSNSVLVSSMLQRAGYAITTQQRIQDDRALLAAAVDEAAKQCDLLLISGGASVGDYDFARMALEANGFEFLIHSVHLRPGKPIGIARRGRQWAFALPGNPVSHLVALRLFVIPLLRALEGDSLLEPELLNGILEVPPATGVPRRPTFWPAKAAIANGVPHLHPCRFLSSGDVIGIASANALLYLEVDTAIPAAGATVPFLHLWQAQ